MEKDNDYVKKVEKDDIPDVKISQTLMLMQIEAIKDLTKSLNKVRQSAQSAPKVRQAQKRK